MRLRVLHCIASMSGAGAERQVALLAQGLVAAGQEVHVALLRAAGPNLSRMVHSGAAVHNLPCYGHHDPRLVIAMIRLIRRIRPDLVHTWLPLMDVVGGLACRATGTPWVLGERNSGSSYPGTWKMRSRRLLAFGARRVVANSRAGTAYWRSQLPASRLAVIPNAVPHEELERVAARGDWPFDGPAPDRLILYAGRFERQKNVLTLVEALARLRPAPDTRAVLFGEGPLRTAVEALVREAGIAPWVVIAGYQHDLWAWIKRADVLVSISDHEGMPNIVLEAMACGCPLVVSDIDEHREILDEASALLVPPRDPEAIAAAIRQTVVRTPPVAARAERARTRSAAWSRAAAAAAYVALYREALARG